MKKERRIFQGFNLERLEKNVQEFKDELKERYISERLLSTNPEYQIEVEYWSEK
jgi:hypothetical protein